MKIETERLLLRPYKATDLSHIQRYAVRQEFFRFLAIPEQTPESVAAFLKDRLEEQRRGVDGDFTFAIEPKDVKFIVGSVRIAVRDVANRHGDLGFALDSDYQRRGYMTEAAKSVLAMGFGQLNLHRIWATADVENERSWRLLERLDMTREGLLREDKLVRGQWRNSYIYSMLAADTQ